MKTLSVKWQRLLTDGQTCPRCGSTEEAIDKALGALRQSLTPLDVNVVLEKVELTTEQFAKDTLQSNTIWINGRLLEDWIDGQTGQSQCCDVCGSNDCITMTVGSDVYEAIPSDLIIKAGLLAAAQLLGQEECGCNSTATRPGGDCRPK